MSVRDHILVMAKAPVAGRVKTRMCPPCTPSEAAAIAGAALADTLDAVAASGAERRIVALDGEPGDWLPPGFEVIAQRGATFNHRLEHAWDAVGGPGLQIGMDTPQATAADLDAGLAALHAPGCDAVLGPTLDGGWWAIGLHSPVPGVFMGVAMSRPTTGRDQRRRIERLGLRCGDIAPMRDLDHFEDVLDLAHERPELRTSRAGLAVAAVEAQAGP